MMRYLRTAAAVVASVVLFTAGVVAMLPKGAKAAYAANTWHWSGEITVAAPNTGPTTVIAYTVPPDVDLTITDIVYTFEARGPSFSVGHALPRVVSHLQARVYEAGPNPNPTNYGLVTPPALQPPVADSATWTMNSDRFRLGTTPIFGADPVHLETNPVFTEDGDETLDFAAASISTEAHHFQTGLVFVSGNDVRIDFSHMKSSVSLHEPIMGGSTLRIHISGLLQ